MYVKDPGRLRRRRTHKGLTQQQLAALVGSTQQYISLLESGKDRDCSERITLKLCRWLEVDVDDYFAPGPPEAPDVAAVSSGRTLDGDRERGGPHHP